MNAIEIKNLTVAYGENIALEDLNLNIEVGSLMALVGPNGAGKSTLIKTILKFLKQITGEIKINAKTLAYVPQRNSVDWDFPTTLFDVVEMGCYGRVGLFKRVSKGEKQKVLKAIEQVGMLEFKDRQISELSGGQQQRAFIARALVQEADIYLMDEPFQGVDSTTEKSIVEILKQLKAEGKTIIVVHHDLQTVPTYFESVALINKAVIVSGKVSEVFTQENIDVTYRKI
ncbi:MULTISPECIES: metal ABC transporter ATP-binding protein [Fusobacterium]|uniref:Metal ABC transporter ATP-binding protein n=2 Tax=Fusobacterium TaxID=848 RepID=A0AAD0AM84_9FUSO|nr:MULTISPECIES: metal ABC transporter ATP-binding protein [Fusobacterium]ATV35051.1 metal ABC transporter ATP-binding protein [Fusobacterium pseudoperiodonticum]ATV62055.1 metal ABC transporter ATP-binding protein [Fusobacterium pseudoperiodonticum]EFE86385.1 ABC transporter, ATP-binding protein [Fusobacterium periodonticum ATCC 33693]